MAHGAPWVLCVTDTIQVLLYSTSATVELENIETVTEMPMEVG